MRAQRLDDLVEGVYRVAMSLEEMQHIFEAIAKHVKEQGALNAGLVAACNAYAEMLEDMPR